MYCLFLLLRYFGDVAWLARDLQVSQYVASAESSSLSHHSTHNIPFSIEKKKITLHTVYGSRLTADKLKLSTLANSSTCRSSTGGFLLLRYFSDVD